jgi:hypothetical protein
MCIEKAFRLCFGLGMGMGFAMISVSGSLNQNPAIYEFSKVKNFAKTRRLY